MQMLQASVRAAKLSTILSALAASAAWGQTMPPVPEPSENPTTEAKRVLGKILFWDEQLSSDNTMACGTCHRPDAGGSDPRVGIHPGPDGITPSFDDIRGSFGVIQSDPNDNYTPHTIFDLHPQVTNRAASSIINAGYASELFWDGRAPTTFTDPQTGIIEIVTGGALESQVVAPPVSDVEMAHAARDWNQIATKLRAVGPLALANNLPPDVDAAIQSFPSYPALFTEAFGDDEINAKRIAFAIAAYERTLVADQAPWDLFMAGDDTALTTEQHLGWDVIRESGCIICHPAPLFTDNTFHNTGLRPNIEDIGREAITGFLGDRGKMKTASLRNLATRPTLMHNGAFTDVIQVFPFYAVIFNPSNPNRDILLPTGIPQEFQAPVTDFIVNGLTDPRVVAESFPFDRPTLRSELPPNPAILLGATPGAAGITPKIIALVPPNVGNLDFKIGVHNALGGATASLVISQTPPVTGELINPIATIAPLVLQGSGAGTGFATVHWPIDPNPALDGEVFYMQWLIDDPAAPSGEARSDIAQLTLFAGDALPPGCPGDADGSNHVNLDDLQLVLFNFGSPGPAGDLDHDGDTDIDDLQTVLFWFGASC